MQKNTEIYQYFIDHADELTEDWYVSLDKSDPKGVYASKDPTVIANVKKQNNEFHYHLARIFITSEEAFFQDFQPWIVRIATDQKHLDTPIHFIIREFIRTREQYILLMGEFVNSKNEIDQDVIDKWNKAIVKLFDEIILRVSEEVHQHSYNQLTAQQELINELSSPVITLSKTRALLPLVGDIDTARAAAIMDNTLSQCAEKKVSHLFIDLSGVVIIDTMVAHQIFQLIHGLKLIGVKTTLSGIRPEIATTAIQLGLSFEDISIVATLSKAISQDVEFSH
ncbi:STAS domain-containing protein [Bacillus sp. B1-b2]|uniref:STAS domain-containing protein n=1 Tax=Bacillus sp. B1-b2 TaxID=2653201 RepID=UPI001261E433|nr:STAS domain-containing protein [Bacillus sp. B1-b2]KAB7672479.1 STAS domain-containing protein [Bacillus sp. B1-b2]